MTVGAEPGEVVEAVVGAVFVEVVDGEKALVGQSATLADLRPSGAQHPIAVDTVAALPIGMLVTRSLSIGPGCATAIIAEEEAAP
jgi:hypothetical protein